MANTTESDEIVEMFCEICYKKGNRHVTAVGFCIDCVNYYCEMCLDYHAQFLPDHKQQDRYQMPQDFHLEKCEQHSKELVKFYCQSCEDSACIVCKETLHKECQRVCHLPKLAYQFEEGDEFHFVEDLLNSVENEAGSSIEMMHTNAKQVIKEAKSALLEQKGMIMTMFDDFEKEVKKHENAFKSDVENEMKKLVQIQRSVQTMKSDIDNKKMSTQRCKLFLATKAAKRQVKHIKERLNDVKPYIESINVPKYCYERAEKVIGPGDLGKVTISSREEKPQTLVTSYETGSFIKPKKQTSLSRDSFVGTDKQMSTVVTNTASSEEHSSDRVSLVSFTEKGQTSPRTGSITSHTKQSLKSNPSPALLEPIKYRELEFDRRSKSSDRVEENAKEKKETNENKNKNGILEFILLAIVLFLSVLNKNQYRKEFVSLKFEPKNIGYISTTHLFILGTDNFYTLNLENDQLTQLPFKDTIPSSVTRHSDNMVAMLFPSCEIRFVQVSFSPNVNQLEYFKTMKVGDNCKDVVYGKSTLFVLCSGKNRIESIDRNGNFLPSWPLHKKILKPSNIAVSPNNNLIYISDTESNAVFRLTMKGVLRASYKHKRLIGPTGMTFDTAGNLYVTGYQSHNVFKINADLTDGHEYFNKSNGLDQPMSIVYSKRDNAMYIGSVSDKTIRVLKIT